MANEIAKIDKDSGLPLVSLTGYRALDADPELMREVLKENLGGGFSEFDLDRVTVPSGGGITWEVPTLEGVQTTQEITGIIIWYRDVRSYWKHGFDESGGGTPPDCASLNSTIGMGDPGGHCAQCPFSQFGSAGAGGGQACKQVRQLFMLRGDSVIPMLISSPPTSLKGVRNYMMRLSGRMVPYYGVTTKLTLVKDKNAAGITYAKIKPEPIERLVEFQFNVIKGLRRAMIGGLEAIDLDAGDYSATTG